MDGRSSSPWVKNPVGANVFKGSTCSHIHLRTTVMCRDCGSILKNKKSVNWLLVTAVSEFFVIVAALLQIWRMS